MEIKKAEISDAPSLSKIHNECFAEVWSVSDFTDRMSDGSIWTFLIVKENDIPIGYLSAYIIFDEASIADVAVLGKYRKSGYGSAVLSHFIDFCTNADITKIMLEVRKSNIGAISIYKKYGFEITGISKNHYANPSEDALLMSKII